MFRSKIFVVINLIKNWLYFIISIVILGSAMKTNNGRFLINDLVKYCLSDLVSFVLGILSLCGDMQTRILNEGIEKNTFKQLPIN